MDWQEKVEYALQKTKVLQWPKQKLETFGNSMVHYYMLTELLDTVDQVRIREGRVTAERPKVVTPHYLQQALLQGFSNDARGFLDWLSRYADGLRFLEYGYRFGKETWSDQVVSGSIPAIAERVQQQAEERKDPLVGIVRGVDDLWEISLIKFITDVTRGSIDKHVADLSDHRLLDLDRGVPRFVRDEIERTFAIAEKDPTQVRALGTLLEKQGLLDDYQDRFFALIRRWRG